MKRLNVAIMLTMAAMVTISGCVGHNPGQRPEPSTTYAWSETVASVQPPGGHLVSLQVTRHVNKPDVGSSRCWRLVESLKDGTEVAKTSACHAGDATAAARVFQSIVVVSPCTTGTTAVIHGATGDTTVPDIADGIFLVPPASITRAATALRYSCLNSTGGVGPTVEAEITSG